MIDVRKIGMSDLSTIVGLNPFSSPIDLFRRVTTGETGPATLAMEFGNHNEPFLIRQWETKTGGKSRGPRLIEIPGKPFLRCNLDADAEIGASSVVVDAKTSGWRMAKEWGDGGDNVPQHVITQMQGYLWATGYQRCDVVALLGGSDLHIYTLTPEKELQEMLINAACRFWRDHIQTGRPPPPDGSESYGEFLKAKFPRNERPLLTSTPEIDGLAVALRQAELTWDMADQHLNACKDRIKALLGDAEGVHGSWGKLSWRNSKSREHTDWKALAIALGATPEKISAHTTSAPGARSFRVTWKEEES